MALVKYYTEVLYDKPKSYEPETSHVVYKAADVEAWLTAKRDSFDPDGLNYRIFNDLLVELDALRGVG